MSARGGKVRERLQKIIARAGVASRRHAEQLIVAGQVTVNGRVVTELGTKADPERESIKVAGKRLRVAGGKLYVMLYKPSRCVATLSDPERRKTLKECLRGVAGRVYPVGRLDYHAEGLLLLTNDGDLANEVLGARGLRQTYWIKVKGALSEKELEGVERKAGARIRLLKRAPNAWYEVSLTDARRDALRRALLAAGHPTEKMKRVRLANLELGWLRPGQHRALTPREVDGLRKAAAAARQRRDDAGVPTRRPAAATEVHEEDSSR